MEPMNDQQKKILCYVLAWCQSPRSKEAIRNGMLENLPLSDVSTPNEITAQLDEWCMGMWDEFDRWGLGHTLPGAPKLKRPND